MCLTSNRDNVQELLNSHRKNLTERNDALKAMVMALKEVTMAATKALSTSIEELKGKLALCRATVGNGVSSAALNCEDVSKSKEFVGTRSACDVDNFLWRMEHYFQSKGIVEGSSKSTDKIHSEIETWEDFQHKLKGQFYLEFTAEEAQAKLRLLMQRGTVGECVREFKELMLYISDVTKKEALLVFMNGLKSWVRQEVEQEGVQGLLKAMTVAESTIKLDLGKDKLEFSKSEESRKCLKKSVLSKKDKPKGKTMRLGLNARGVEANETKSEKKPVECFLCYGPHRLWKCPRKSAIKRDDGSDKKPKKLGLSKGKVKANRAKRSEKK
ncbi:hypothetical protein Gogos_021208 [Gossypium gossypioides]|uniref:Retrotransposon gag domain-containing protein n=1 Tax=Gossypium gossypioides TaxID=34282 RepID=A0A7J9CZR7_GOSGO|nr:hypothetical protein [Gossypium gossypioides]